MNNGSLTRSGLQTAGWQLEASASRLADRIDILSSEHRSWADMVVEPSSREKEVRRQCFILISSVARRAEFDR
jgi:hypothetical protein